MTRHHETALILAVYLTLLHAESRDESEALAVLGIGRAECDALRDLSVADLLHLAALPLPCLTIHLNRDRLAQGLAYLQQQREQDRTFQTLIRLDAPYAMMRIFYGLNTHDFAHWRRRLNVPLYPGGRSSELDATQAERFWLAWKALLGARDPNTVTPDEFIALQALTQCPLRAIWMTVYPWDRTLAVPPLSPLATTSLKGQHHDD